MWRLVVLAHGAISGADIASIVRFRVPQLATYLPSFTSQIRTRWSMLPAATVWP